MAKTWFDRFTAFAGAQARKHGTCCETINDITPEIAGAWFDAIKKQYTWETVTKMMTMMRGAFHRFSTSGKANPFADIITRGGGGDGNGKVSRKPLTATELERLFDLTSGDAFVHPLVVTAACTGMRIGDVCNLKWRDIDLKSGLIECTTSKTGTTVTIPVMPPLMAVLSELNAVPGDGTPAAAHVFPAAAAKYNARQKIGNDGKPVFDKHGNPVMTDSADAIYKAAQPYFARAVMGDDPEPAMISTDAEQRDLTDAIADAGFTDQKRARIVEVYNQFKAGKQSKDIAAALGVPRSVVSMDLRDAEKLTGETLRPRAIKSAQRQTRLDLIERTRASRGVGKRAASVYGWHSLRHTFVVMALDAGVPVEKVRQIVGHGECETTIANYYNPTKEHEAARIRAQMANTPMGGGNRRGKKAIAQAPAAITPVNASIDSIIACMTKKQKMAFVNKLMASM